ncbi:MAG: transglutaminase-like domain-containing protein [Allosphingosinicella sp.]
MVDSYSGDVALRELTLKVIFPSCRPKDEPAQALAIGKWVQDRTNYVHEGVETFQRPETTIRRKAGDCDDYSVLIASMLGTVGIRNKLCILKINGRWAHIFPVAIVVDGGRLHRLTLDGTLLKRKDEAPFDPDDDPISEMINPVAIVKARGDKVETLFV